MAQVYRIDLHMRGGGVVSLDVIDAEIRLRRFFGRGRIKSLRIVSAPGATVPLNLRYSHIVAVTCTPSGECELPAQTE